MASGLNIHRKSSFPVLSLEAYTKCLLSSKCCKGEHRSNRTFCNDGSFFFFLFNLSCPKQ